MVLVLLKAFLLQRLISIRERAYTDGFYEEMILTDKPLSFGYRVVDSHSSLRPVKAKTRRSGVYEDVQLTDKPLSFGYSLVERHSNGRRLNAKSKRKIDIGH